MTTTACPICKKKIKARDFYGAHRLIRSHLLMEHPNEMCDLQTRETEARRNYDAAMELLYEEYGLAVRPIRMSL